MKSSKMKIYSETKGTFLLIAMALFAWSCVEEDSSEIRTVEMPLWEESQCGADWDWQDVELYDGTLGVTQNWVDRHQSPVGYASTMGCTGTLISRDLFLSAGHCYYDVGDTVEFNYQLDPSGNLRASTATQVTAIIEQEYNTNWDYAIVRLSGTPGDTFGFARIADRDIPVSEQVNIIQHPQNARPKKIHTGPVLMQPSNNNANWFEYEVDTFNGSSGSGVLASNGELIGVHTNGGCDTTTPAVEGNRAMRMTRLIDHSSTLAQLASIASGHGFMIQSDRDDGLAINAWNGAVHGAYLRLHTSCTKDNPDCTWSYVDGMLVSDRDPMLAINAWGGAAHSTYLRLHSACVPTNPDCTWTLKNGVFYSDSDPSLAINAWNGATHGAYARLNSGCSSSNLDCTWTLNNLKLTSDRDPLLSINAWNGATHGAYLRLNNGCANDNPDCTWIVKKGEFRSSRDTSLAINAWGGAAHGTYLRLHSSCSEANPDCTWTWSQGSLFSDNNDMAMNAWNGAVHGAYVRLHQSCTPSNPDCVFHGIFAQP